MSEKVKEEVKEPEVKEEVKEEIKEEVKEEIKDSKGDLGFSPFIHESDIFDIIIRCYKDKEKGLLVDKVDTEFEEDKQEIRGITFTFKYPSQGDFNIISTQAGAIVNEDDAPDHINLNKLEFARLLVLIRKWSLPEELSNSNLVDLDPKIVKAVIYGLREKLNLNGIF